MGKQKQKSAGGNFLMIVKLRGILALGTGICMFAHQGAWEQNQPYVQARNICYAIGYFIPVRVPGGQPKVHLYIRMGIDPTIRLSVMQPSIQPFRRPVAEDLRPPFGSPAMQVVDKTCI